MVADEIKTVLSLMELMEESIVGQTHALERIAQSVRTSRANLRDPRMPIGESISEGLKIHNFGTPKERFEIVIENLRKVDLEDHHARRYPHEFSGGQRQRIGIARALALRPKFIICDEPVSALDVSIQSQVLNILNDLQQEFGLTYLFIAHNLSVVEHISHRVSGMYLCGRGAGARGWLIVRGGHLSGIAEDAGRGLKVHAHGGARSSGQQPASPAERMLG